MDREQFRELRLNKGFTLTEMAFHLGVSMRSISNWESGIYPIPRPIQKLVKELWGNKRGDGECSHRIDLG